MKIFAVLFSLFLLVTFIPISESNRITVTYPSGTDDLTIKTGEITEIEIHLYNKNENHSLRANLTSSSLNNISLSFSENIVLPPDSMSEVILELSSEEVKTFSGEVHVEFLELENDFSSDAGGNVIAGSSIPIGGEIVVEPRESSFKITLSTLFKIILPILSLLVAILIFKRRFGGRSSPWRRFSAASPIAGFRKYN